MQRTMKVLYNLIPLSVYFLVSRFLFMIGLIVNDSSIPYIFFGISIFYCLLCSLVVFFTSSVIIFEIAHISSRLFLISIYMYISGFLILEGLFGPVMGLQMIILNIVFVAFNLWKQAINFKVALIKWENVNIQSGSIDLNKGKFQMNNDLVYLSHEQKAQQDKRLRQLYLLQYIAPTIGILIARIFTNDLLYLMISLVFILFGNYLFSNTASKFGLILYLHEKEKLIQKQITFT